MRVHLLSLFVVAFVFAWFDEKAISQRHAQMSPEHWVNSYTLHIEKDTNIAELIADIQCTLLWQGILKIYVQCSNVPSESTQRTPFPNHFAVVDYFQDYTYAIGPRAFVVPFDPYFLSGNAWHLQPEYHNIVGAWSKFGVSGRGVQAAIVDTAVQFQHPELRNYVANDSFNYITMSKDIHLFTTGECGSEATCHGTVVSGALLAKTNTYGSLGVAPSVSYSSKVILGVGRSASIQRINMMFEESSERDWIYQNSWGFDERRIYAPLDPLTMESIRKAYKATESSRNGLGKIIVFASGNGGLNATTIFDQYLNDEHVIAVSAINQQYEALATVSMFGCNIFMTAFGQDIGNTPLMFPDLLGTDGYSRTDFASFNPTGTSFTSPLVSGISALMLEVNPYLSWRDVQAILVKSAKQPKQQLHNFINAAGVYYSLVFGYGYPDAELAVSLALRWINLPDQQRNQYTSYVGGEVVQLLESPLLVSACDSDIIEHIKLTISAESLFGNESYSFAVYNIHLTSPSGTTVPVQIIKNPIAHAVIFTNFTILVHGFWGEHQTVGVWKLLFHNIYPATRNFKLANWTLEILGTKNQGFLTPKNCREAKVKFGQVTLYVNNNPLLPWLGLCINYADFLPLMQRTPHFNVATIESGGRFSGTGLSTWYSALKINTDTLVVDTCNRTRAYSEGSVTLDHTFDILYNAYATATGCAVNTPYAKGWADINLIGTPFELSLDNFVLTGASSFGELQEYSNQHFVLRANGNCGYYRTVLLGDKGCNSLQLKYYTGVSTQNCEPQLTPRRFSKYKSPQNLTQHYILTCTPQSSFIDLPRSFQGSNTVQYPASCTRTSVGGAMKTSYYRVALLPNDVVSTRDNAFSYTLGEAGDVNNGIYTASFNQFGYANTSCNLNPATASIDLRGTVFKLTDTQLAEYQSRFITNIISTQAIQISTNLLRVSELQSPWNFLKVEYYIEFPQSCWEIKQKYPKSETGSYTLYFQHNPLFSYEVICYMNSTPFEMLELHRPASAKPNYAEWHGEASSLYTTFYQVPINPYNLLINTCGEFALVQSHGSIEYKAVTYNVANLASTFSSTNRVSTAHFGLHGTPFAINAVFTSRPGSADCNVVIGLMSRTIDLSCRGVFGITSNATLDSCWNLQLEFVKCGPNQYFNIEDNTCKCLPCYTSASCNIKDKCCGKGICDLNVQNCSCPKTTASISCQNCSSKYGTPCSGNGVCFCHGCVCKPGFEGADCSIKKPNCNYPCPNDCHAKYGYGVCNPCIGLCECMPGGIGVDCHAVTQVECGDLTCVSGVCCSLTSSNVRSNYCVRNCSDCINLAQAKGSTAAITFTCDTGTVCPVGYKGKNCDERTCPGTPPCSGHGACDNSTFACACDTAWSSTSDRKIADCSQQKCPVSLNLERNVELECSGNGECNYNDYSCTCASGYQSTPNAPYCTLPVCNVTCARSTTPSCITPNSCPCPCTSQGAKCDLFSCKACKDLPSCSNHGQCIEADTFCQCSRGFSGKDCELPTSQIYSNTTCTAPTNSTDIFEETIVDLICISNGKHKQRDVCIATQTAPLSVLQDIFTTQGNFDTQDCNE